MKPIELRIGNLLLYEDKYVKLFTIIDAGSDALVRIGNDISGKFKIYKEHFLSECKPIILTEEWLLKFGFEPRNECRGIGAIYDLKHKHIEDKINGWKFGKAVAFVHDKENTNDIYLTCLANPTAYKLKYIHQLQNLYFSLTGEELIYKP